MRRSSPFFATLVAAALASGPALANTEVITSYDARASGMGLTGTAFINSAAAIQLNPANLTDIKNLDLTLSLAPNFSNATTPYVGLGATGPAALSVTSKMVLTPLAFLGVGYRLHHGVAVGLSAELTQVKGVQFDHVPLSLTDPTAVASLGAVKGQVAASQLFYEVRAPVAVNVNRWLTVSAGYRMGFFYQGAKIKADALPVASFKQDVQGHNFAGAQAGILIKPSSNVRLGLSYRSKMVLLGSSKTTAPVPGTQTLATARGNRDVPYISPHMFTAGVAVKLLGNRLTLAGDFKYWLFKDAYTGVHSYRDAMSGHLGAEYMVTAKVPVRAGYVLGVSATRKQFASPVDTTPGLQHAGTVGSGYHTGRVDFDASLGYGASSTNVTQSATALGGHYGLKVVLVNVSATVHI